MNATFLKREPGIRLLPVLTAFAVVWLWLTLPIATEIGTLLHIDDRTGEPPRVRWLDPQVGYVILVQTVVMASIVAIARFLAIRQRIREFERALPATARRVVLERVAATWLALAVPLVVASLVGAFQGVGPLGAYAAVVARVLLAITLAVLVPFAYRPGAAHLAWYEALPLAVLSIGVLFAPAAAPPGALDVPYLVATAAAAAWLLFGLGPAAAPDDPRVVRASGGGAAASLPVRAFGPLRWTLLRSALLRPSFVFLAVIGAAFMALAGDGNVVILVWLSVLISTVALRNVLHVLNGLGPLPVSRARLLRLVAPVSLALIAGSLAVSTLVPRPRLSFSMLSTGVALEAGSDETIAGEDEYRLHVRVPPALWKVADSPAEAVVSAPWGETSESLRHPVFYGADTSAYCPYDVQEDNSVRFLMWQLARALRDVHGFEGTWEDVHARWFEELDPAATIAATRPRQGDSDDWGFTAHRGAQAPHAPWFAALCGVLLWAACSAWVLRPNVPDVRGRRWVAVLRSNGPGIAIVAVIMFGLVAVERDDRALVPVLLARADVAIDAALGSSPWLWALLVLGLAGAAYAYLGWRLGRVEVPPPSINGWTRKPVSIF